MCQALCFMDTVTNALGNLTEQAIIHPFNRYQGSDNLNNLPKKQMPLLFASKPVLDLLVTLINKLKKCVQFTFTTHQRTPRVERNNCLTGEEKTQGRHKKVKAYPSAIQVIRKADL